MKKHTLLLLDFSNLFYRGLYVHTELSYNGVPTGGLYGFISQFAYYVNEFRPDKVVACNDSRPYARSEAFPQYKANRKYEKDPDVAAAIKLNRRWCHEFLDLIDEPMIERKGWEADDVIAVLARQYEHDYKRIVVVSNDNDLYQLLDQENLALYLGTADNRRYMQLDDFLKDYPLPDAESWIAVIALTGGHNGLPGVRGIGEKTAMKLLTAYDNYRPYMKVYLKNKEAIDLSKRLARLPFPDLEITPFDLRIVDEDIDYREITKFFRRFGIQLTQSIEQAIAWVEASR